MRYLLVVLLLGLVAGTLAQDTFRPEEDLPLVRCRRPLCDMFCEHGQQTDKQGCPVCKCLADPCVEANHDDTFCSPGSVCKAKECTHHPCTQLEAQCVPGESFPCAIPMCADQCPNGYAYNKYGCMTCRCKVAVCEDFKCGENERCKMHMPKCDEKTSDCQMVPMCVPDDGHYPQVNSQCPDLKCDFDIQCEFGYKTDEDGCNTCECNTGPCDNHQCEEGTVCEPREATELCVEGEDCPILPVCRARPLCHEARDTWDTMRDMPHMAGHGGSLHMAGHDAIMPSPDCDPDTGHFTPRQCHMHHCWCVDDRGLEIPGTRTEHGTPNCAINRTTELELEMLVHHELENIEENMEELEKTLRQHFSRWMLMEEKWITIVEISPHENLIKVLRIHILVIHDGETDLPSAANYFKKQLHSGRCNMDFNGHTLKPDADSVKIHHKKFEVQPPVLPEEPLVDRNWPTPRPTPVTCWQKIGGFYHRQPVLVITGSLGIFILLVILISMIILIIKKRKRAAYQFRHRRLENMDNFKKNLVLSSSLELPVDAEKKVKPEDMDGPVIEVPPATENSSLA